MAFAKRLFVSAAVFLPLAVLGGVFIGLWAALAALLAGAAAFAAVSFGLHRVIFDNKNRAHRAVYAACALCAVLFSFAVGAVSIQGEWTLDYPLPGSVDDYGCYPQVFDSFMKGRTDIDTDYDLSVFEKLENPYDTAARRKLTGERYGVTWDRAYYNGRLYSYFGAAPVVFLYFPFYFLTGRVPSDALAACIMAAVAAAAMFAVLRQLVSRLNYGVPLLLMCLGGLCLPFGALLWPTVTNANFYHLAVLSAIASVCCTFTNLLAADSSKGAPRKTFFAFAGVCAACVVGSRPTHAVYLLAAAPLIIKIIKERRLGAKSVAFDALAFGLPLFSLGALIMVYNNARFGSPFDFGNNYQLTLWDMSLIKPSITLLLPAFFHYFLHVPLIDSKFPFLHPASARLSDYGVNRGVYVSDSVGALFFPCVYGAALLPYSLKESGKTAGYSASIAVAAAFVLAVFDMNYAGVHLRYAADIMFVLSFAGVFGFVAAVGRLISRGKRFADVYCIAAAAFTITVLVSLALCFDNERDMIMKYHEGFYAWVKGLFGA